MSGNWFVGAISGTSVDGLDVALLDVSGQLRIHSGRTYALPEGLRNTLLALGQPGTDSLDDLGRADAALGRFIAECALRLLDEEQIDPRKVRAIGSHGQTVRHRPLGTERFTLQIGDPNLVAELTGITTVSDFRRRDMAAGGQGAPLVPPFHRALFRSDEEDRATLNIGGIANIALLPSDASTSSIGFDTGPGNGLMDAWITKCRGQPFDVGGAWGAGGSVDEVLLARFLDDPYFLEQPPKSTGREYFNLKWLERALDGATAFEIDIQATLRALTAQSVSNAISRWASSATRVIVCGGGRLNNALMQDLRDRIDCPVEPSEKFGIDGDSIEAAAFAWLAWRTIEGLAGNDPKVTGAAGERVLGGIYPGIR